MTTICEMVARGRVNVCAAAADNELRAIHERIDGELVVRDVAGLAARLEELALCRDRPARGTLDLIAPSGGRWSADRTTWLGNFLTLGDLSFLETRGPLLRQAGITTVRLLGCETQVAPAGCKLIEALNRALEPHGVLVRGTFDVLHLAHFDADGLNFEGRKQLVPSKVGLASLATLPVLDFAFDGLEGHQTFQAAPALPGFRMPPKGLARLADVLVPRWTPMPGLLARPAFQILVNHGDAGFARLEVLLGNRLLRAFPRGRPTHGAICRVADPRRLGELLAPPLVTPL